MKKDMFIIILTIVSYVNICKANFAKDSTRHDSLMMEYVVKINALIEKSDCDTVDVWSPPAYSDIVSVVAYAIETDKSMEITYNSGTRIGFVRPGYIYIDQVKKDNEGNVISGLQAITLSGCRMVVYVQHCPKCIFKKMRDL